jgi:hypothetical protein
MALLTLVQGAYLLPAERLDGEQIHFLVRW